MGERMQTLQFLGSKNTLDLQKRGTIRPVAKQVEKVKRQNGQAALFSHNAHPGCAAGQHGLNQLRPGMAAVEFTCAIRTTRTTVCFVQCFFWQAGAIG